MDTREMVSIVIPTHNRASLLQRAVDSALSQTYPNIEIIVVSDGSTDETEEIMKRKCENSQKIRFISYAPAAGANVARNKGINASCGSIIAFLDDDDEWHRDKIEKQIEVFKNDDNIGLVCTGINSVEENNETMKYIPPALYDSSKEILMHNCIGSTTTVAIKKEIFELSGMFDEELPANQDYDLWIRVCQVTKIGVVKEPCVEYYNYASSGQISSFTDRYMKAFEYINKKYSVLFGQLSDKENKKRIKNVYISLAKKCIRNGNRIESRKYIKKAAKERFDLEIVFIWFASMCEYDVVVRCQGILRRITGKNF